MSNNKIRNFSIIAHVDHGKSTLADRFIENCQGLTQREMKDQVLDSMEIERERGITIKAQAVSLNYKANDLQTYNLTLIDTPGHVDFSYEVSKSLSACEGALLVVDASQGVQAQTVANCYNAIEQNLTIIPVINKIDLQSADTDRVKGEIEDVIGIEADNAVLISAKAGIGIKDVLEQIVKQIPPPKIQQDNHSYALIIDSWFDSYVGIVSLVKIISGKFKRNQKIQLFSTKSVYGIETLGIFTPKRVEMDELNEGEVGFIIARVKDINSMKVGDTISLADNPVPKPLPDFRQIQPKVFSGLFPTDSSDYDKFRDALGKLSLNDASFRYEPEVSDALGYGFRCGFLGLLHMDIITQRLDREYSLDIINTAPTVAYEIITTKGESVMVDNPLDLPPRQNIKQFKEPIITATILVIKEYVGAVMNLCIARRGVEKNITYLNNQVKLMFDLPLSEVVLDFFDKLKSVSKGYASMDYEFKDYQVSSLIKLEIMINSKKVDSLAIILYEKNYMHKARELVEKLKEVIPRQLYDVAIQACIGGKIVARSTVKALRKNVTAKCYGGDITRKKKLLEKQKKGKKRMRSVGNVEIPQDAFMAILNI